MSQPMSKSVHLPRRTLLLQVATKLTEFDVLMLHSGGD